MRYYCIPFLPGNLILGQAAEKSNLQKSIHQNIRLIIQSLTLSYRFDPYFGCIVHKFQAQTPPQRRSNRVWRDEIQEKIQKNLKYLLQRYEARVRIKDVMVDLQMPRQHEHEKPITQVRIELNGQLTIGQKDTFHFPDSEVDEDASGVFPLLIPVGH